MHELPRTILFLLKKRNDTKFHPGNLQNKLWGHFTSGQPQYPPQYAKRNKPGSGGSVDLAPNARAPRRDMETGQHGWRHLSRRARDGKRSGF
jgi:hypothetical protein